MFRRFVFVDFPTFSNTARSSSRRAANRIEKDLIAFRFPLRLTLAARAGRRRLGSTYHMRAADEMNQRRLRPLKPEGFVLAVLLSWQRLHRPRMRAGSLGSSPASTSSTRSSGQWSAMVLGAPHRPWCLPHPSGPSPGQTHRGSLASTRARARRCAFEVYGLRPRERRLSLAFLHSSHREPEDTRCGQPEVEHTLYIKSPIGGPACLGYVSREGPPAGHPRFMGHRRDGCRRHGRRPSVRRLQGLLVAPRRTATIISIGKRKAPDPSGMVHLLQITWTHPLAQVACRPARLD